MNPYPLLSLLNIHLPVCLYLRKLSSFNSIPHITASSPGCFMYAEQARARFHSPIAYCSANIMSLQTPESNPDNNAGTHQVESLKLWSCINCRRRKVRCDRRHPCAPCSRNKTECVFPVSGRIPRRSRDSNYLKKSTQKQTELLGRLRRLEAMVGDLGTQVEHAAAVSEDDHPLESSVSAANATSAAPSETVGPSYGSARNSQTAYGNPRTTLDEVHAGSSRANDTSESSQSSDQSRSLVVTNDGDIVVDDRFWTVFCKEVSSIAAHGIFSRPTRLEPDAHPWHPYAHCSLTCIQGGANLRSRPWAHKYPLPCGQQLNNDAKIRSSKS